MDYSIIAKDMSEVYNNGLDFKFFNNKTILITGAYGMVTSYLTQFFIYLNKFNINVKIVVLVRNKEKLFERLPESKYINNIVVYETELNEKISINEKVDYIIHAASFASPNYYSVCPVEVIKPNVTGTIYLLEYAKEHLSKDGCFIFFSAGNIYGEWKYNTPITEDSFGGLDPLHIYNCYCESKRMGETLCKAYEIEYGIRFKSLRIWHTYSPYMNIDEDPRVFASFIKNVKNNKNIVIHSNGLGMRSFCYITDAISMMLYVIVNGKNNEAYNICNTHEYLTIKELANVIANLRVDRNLKVIFEDRNTDESYVENVVLKNVMCPPSNEKVTQLGFSPKISIKEGFDRVLKFMEL